MKANMSYKSKKIAIISAIIVVLIIAISIGAYYFIKGNDDTQAAYLNSEQSLAGSDNDGETDTTGSSDEQENPVDTEENEDANQSEQENDGENTDNDEQASDNDNIATENGTNADDDTTSDNDADADDGTTSDNDADVPNEEYTQVDIIETEVERIEQEVRVGWAGMSLAKAQMSTNIQTNKPNLTYNKTSKVINSINETDNAVQEGSEIVYEITITNNSTDMDAKNVNVLDKIPVGTKLKDGTITNNGTLINDSILWVVNIERNSTVTVSFTVVVENTANEINNIAMVDGKDTPETTNPVIETNKKAYTTETLKVGSRIDYVITIENKGETVATTTVTDAVPEGTTLVENSIEGAENYTVENDVITWNKVTVNAGETAELKFAVTVNKFTGESMAIKNTAIVGDKETNTEEDTAYNPVLSIEKIANPTKVKEGDTITYTITVTNTGKVDGIATIKDTVPTGTTLVENSIENARVEEINGQKVITWENVNVAKDGGKATVSFEVTVNTGSGLNDKISNIAYLINDDGTEIPTEPVETDVEAHIVFIENGGIEVSDIDGMAGDVLEDTTMPETEKAGYTFDGWYTDDGTFENKANKLPEKLTAGTTYYYAKWVANTNTAYTVEFYYEKDGKYSETPSVKDLTRTGTTDTQASVTDEDKNPETNKPETLTGDYVFDAENGNNVLSGTIKGDGSLVLKVYFKEQFTVTYEAGEYGTFKIQTTSEINYGEKTPAFEGETSGKAGYTFAGWSPEVESHQQQQ